MSYFYKMYNYSLGKYNFAIENKIVVQLNSIFISSDGEFSCKYIGNA